MSERGERFTEFFMGIHGFAPYAWQVRLVDYVAEQGTWPEGIQSPTGSGKTAVVDAHVFLNAFAGEMGIPTSVPRRMFLVVNRRSLVDSQFDYAAEMRNAIEQALAPDADCAPIVHEATEKLLLRSGSSAANPLQIGSMRGGDGGSAFDRSWRLYPETVMVVCATPDMFGSRLLFRGYGVSHAARAQEAGLLAYDSVVVIDEAHLNNQLSLTARQVARIESLSTEKADRDGFPPCLCVVDSTATPASGKGGASLGVTEYDLERDAELKRRLCARKVVSVEPVVSAKTQYVSRIVETCRSMAKREGSVGVIVNTVSLALAVASALRESVSGEGDVVCVVGRMRPLDRSGAVSRLPRAGGCGAKFVVGTQALEVGIDYDLRALVTELAPASALAQRFGRVNRFGRFDEASIVVFNPIDPKGPYAAADLETARAWVESLEGDASAWAVSQSNVPSQSRHRVVLQRLERADASYLSHTSEDIWAENTSLRQSEEVADLDLWLRDELGSAGDHDVSIVVRSGLPEDDECACGLLSRVPPDPREAFPSEIRVFLAAVRAVNEGRLKKGSEPLRAFVASDGVTFSCETTGEGFALSPGATVVLDASDAPLFVEGAVARSGIKELGVEAACANDAYPRILELDGFGMLPFEVGEQLNRALGGADFKRVARAAEKLKESALSCSLSAEDGEDEQARFALAVEAWRKSLDEVEDRRFAAAATYPEIVFEKDEYGCDKAAHIVCRPNLAANDLAAEEIESPVAATLKDHSDAVSEKAKKIAGSIGVSDRLSHVLGVSGAYHDAGKRDPRFQKLLRGEGSSCVEDLAKSPQRSRSFVRDEYRKLGLVGWRHEQLSAAIAWSELKDDPARLLATRLVGTSHGRGRDIFYHGAQDLTYDKSLKARYGEAIEELYGLGVWEWIAEESSRRVGFWKTAYLEALLRAADARFSAGDGDEA